MKHWGIPKKFSNWNPEPPEDTQRKKHSKVAALGTQDVLYPVAQPLVLFPAHELFLVIPRAPGSACLESPRPPRDRGHSKVLRIFLVEVHLTLELDASGEQCREAQVPKQ